MCAVAVVRPCGRARRRPRAASTSSSRRPTSCRSSRGSRPRAGDYIDTIYITQQTGTFGLGNRPGRFDFNSGPHWPYGRRITTFPVWSHARHRVPGDVPGDAVPERRRPTIRITASIGRPARTTQRAARTTSVTRSIRARARTTTASRCSERRRRLGHRHVRDAGVHRQGRVLDDPTVTTGYPPRTDRHAR